MAGAARAKGTCDRAHFESSRVIRACWLGPILIDLDRFVGGLLCSFVPSTGGSCASLCSFCCSGDAKAGASGNGRARGALRGARIATGGAQAQSWGASLGADERT